MQRFNQTVYLTIRNSLSPSEMDQTWRQRLKRIIDEAPDLTEVGVSRKAGLSRSTVNDIIKKGTTPSIDNFLAICKAIGVRPSILLEGIEDAKIVIPIVGYVSAGEGWIPVDDHAQDPLEFDLGSHDTIGVEVRGDSMSPVYRDGDTLICYRRFGPNADNLIGQDCVIRTAKGEHYVKILKRGSRPGRFNLKSYNPIMDDVEDVALAWAAPISWIRRGGR